MIPSGEKRFYLAAAGLHLLFIGVTKIIPPPARVLDPEPPIEYFEVEMPKVTPREWRESADGIGSSTGSERRANEARAPRTSGLVTAEGPAAEGDDVVPPTGEGPPNYDEGFSEPEGPEGPGWDPRFPNYAGLGIGMPDVPEAAPTEAPRRARPTREGVNELVASVRREEDAKKGMTLPGASNVASTVKSAVWGSDLPNETKGTLVVKVDASGKVTEVNVVGGTGSAAAWQAVAAAVKASLASRSITLNTDYKKGAIITINVQSKMQLPSGAGPDGAFDIDVGKGSPLGGTFDLSDIGSKPKRQVYTPFSVTPIK